MRKLNQNEINEVTGGGFFDNLEKVISEIVDWLEDKAKPSEGPSGPGNPMPPGGI